MVSGSRWLRKPPAATNLRPSSYVPVRIRWNHRQFAFNRTTHLAFPWRQPCLATRSQHPTLRAVQEYAQVRVSPSRERNMSQDSLDWKPGGTDQGAHGMSFEVPCIKELADSGLYEITQEIRSQVVYGIRLDLEIWALVGICRLPRSVHSNAVEAGFGIASANPTKKGVNPGGPTHPAPSSRTTSPGRISPGRTSPSLECMT
jgi:hypothetical protein